MLRKIHRLKKRLKKPAIGRPIKYIGRRIRALVHPCDKCGARIEEVYKMHSFSGGKENVNYYCRRCYSKMLRRPKEF